MSRRRPQHENDTTESDLMPVEIDPSGVLNAMADAVFIVSRDGSILFHNRACAALFDPVAQNAAHRSIRNIVNERDATQLQKKIHEFLKQDAATFSYYFRKDDSPTRARFFEIAGTKFDMPSHAREVVALTAREVEPGGHAIQYLESSYGAKTYWSWRNDFKTRTTSWPPELSALAGISPEFGAQMTADQVRDLLHPRDRYVLRNVYKRSQEDHAPIVFHSRLRAAGGNYRTCLTHGFIERDKAGNPTGFVGFSCDITKEVEADRMLRENEMQLRELVEQISDMVALRDGEGRLLYISPAVQRLLGYDPSQSMTMPPSSHIHPDDIAPYQSIYKNMPVDGESVSITFRVRHADGRYIWLESRLRCLAVGPDGRPSRIASISRDITERKNAEEALANARERAEAASATKSRFLANMSHELRTPLNAIIGFSDIIHRELFGAVGNTQYKEYARLIQESGAHLLDLINDVLDMSKIEAGKFELRLEDLDVEDVVNSCMTLMEPHAQKSKLMLVAKLGNRPRPIRADRRAVKQVLLNLMTNAIKFTPGGGLVTVSVENMSDGIVLQVTDNGVGILPEDIDRITQPFEQVTSDPMLAQAGSGLGLALVQSLIGMHMGKLKIDSVPGHGTVVSVYLPVDPRSRRAA